MGSEKFGLVARQPGIVPLQLIGDCGEVLVRTECRWIPERVEPLGHFGGGDVGRFRGNAEALKRHDTRDALRPYARIEHHHIAAQAMADEPRRFVWRETVEQCVEIGEVIGKPVAVRGPFG